jgi:Ser/Thr protein kinase RdoA (MazF antagonist)
MHWPPDHPAVLDPALSRWRSGADELCPDGEPVRVLRYLSGRRVATLVRTRAGEAVLKIFARPRARGNHRRLRAFEASAAAGLLPRSLAVDDSGHVGLLEFVPGRTLDSVNGPRLAGAARKAGDALRRIHESGTELDRDWTIEDEARQLRSVAGPQSRATLERVLAERVPDSAGPAVPSHRDCYPAQAVLTESGIRFVDADDAAMSPPALDVGNFTAHLTKDAITGSVDPADAKTATEAFLEGYGDHPPQLELWERLSLARLAGLAETRHRDPEAMRRLLAALDGPS